jgi:transketolase
MSEELDVLAAHTIRALSMDAVQKANSGHPGMPMGMADLATILWTRHLLVDPDHPQWPDRDRFVLSNGHGSMLLYSLLHLSGFKLTLEDLKSFRQWGSVTAGHPEYEPHLGIEMTTGPLGQGFGTAIGMAMAEAHLNSVFGDDLVNHRTWAFISDGDLMEGLSYETASVAGHLGLDKVTYVYDDNEISIDGSTDITFTEDVAKRFDAAGWQTIDIDGHDHKAIDDAISAVKSEHEKPSLVIAHTHIGYGAPTKQDSSASHGAALGEDEIAGWRSTVGWPDEDFFVPPDAKAHFEAGAQRGRDAHKAWLECSAAAFSTDRDLEDLWKAYFEPSPIRLDGPGFEVGSKIATRAAMGKVFDEIGTKVPGFIGGSADLAGSTKTHLHDSTDFAAADRSGRNIRFGVREHAMGALVNGMALHGGLRPYGATFFVFSDYMRPALRLSALMDIPSIWVYTHESVFLGEDGPTHQPIEHLASLRAMPNMSVLRPADAIEMVEVWEAVLNQSHPAIILGSRQGLVVLDRSSAEGSVGQGGYVIRPGDDIVIVATGSEVSAAIEAAEILADKRSVRVVSMPCVEWFDLQPGDYQRSVLGAGIPVVTVEAAATFGWSRFAGPDGLMIGLDHFGASAPAGRIAEEWGLTGEGIARRISDWLAAPHQA